MSAPSLRQARSTDAGKVGAILSAFIDENDWMPRLHTRAEDVGFAAHMIDKGWVTVAESDGQITGFIARDDAFVHALYIAATARGQGCGTALLQGAQGQSDTLDLWSFQANTRAQAFYRKHGFAEVERTDGARNDEGLPDIRLLWKREGT
ncbi:GNAT family N-acetyltransferase [Tateyamaria sp. SN3-11]|uniref:GNAT family N-acetyltransferase n=1 Tax=Tateyamaria sp. SN3-11 TaxID=3092147 RepID=UPI0039E92602